MTTTPIGEGSLGCSKRARLKLSLHLNTGFRDFGIIITGFTAVGDAAFQKKCLGKMQDIGAQGRAILFVSHDISAITRLCTRAILLEQGKLTADGPAYEVSGQYLQRIEKIGAERIWRDPVTAPHNDVVRLKSLRVFDTDRNVKESFDVRKPIGIELEYEVLEVAIC